MVLDVARLSPNLFWDVERSSVNWQDHRLWLLARILERGRWEDWLEIEKNISTRELRELEPDLRIEARERNFLRTRIRLIDAR